MCSVQCAVCREFTFLAEGEVEGPEWPVGEKVRFPSTSSRMSGGKAARTSGSMVGLVAIVTWAGDLKTSYGDVDWNLLLL